jgi:hypothetical protein
VRTIVVDGGQGGHMIIVYQSAEVSEFVIIKSPLNRCNIR